MKLKGGASVLPLFFVAFKLSQNGTFVCGIIYIKHKLSSVICMYKDKSYLYYCLSCNIAFRTTIVIYYY